MQEAGVQGTARERGRGRRPDEKEAKQGGDEEEEEEEQEEEEEEEHKEGHTSAPRRAIRQQTHAPARPFSALRGGALRSGARMSVNLYANRTSNL